MVAFSGGVDSTFLLWAAMQALGKGKVLAVSANSPSYPQREREEAKRIAELIGADWMEVESHEMEIEGYRKNDSDRCMFCKQELYSELKKIADEKSFTVVVDGSNADDTADYRPGSKALRRLGIPSPLKDAGLTKSEIRQLSRRAALPTWDKPSFACLASRIPYGSEVTEERMRRIGSAEEFLFGIGFLQVRVRDHFPVARIEILPDDMRIIFTDGNREKINEKLKELGYKFVTVDLAGFRSGSMNDLLDKESD